MTNTPVRIIKSFTAIDKHNHDWTAEIEEVFRLTGERAYVDQWGELRPAPESGTAPPKYNEQGFTEHYEPGRLDVDGILDRWRTMRRAAGEKVSYQHEAGAGGYVYCTIEDGEPVINFLYQDESDHVPVDRLITALDITLDIEWEDLPEEEHPVVLTNQDLLERLLNMSPAQRGSHLVWHGGQGKADEFIGIINISEEADDDGDLWATVGPL